MLNIQNYYQLMNKAKKTMFIHKFSNKKKKNYNILYKKLFTI